MSTINPTITDEMIEQAAAAEWASEWPERDFSREADDLRDTYMRSARAALSAVVPEIIQRAKAEALRESADDIERRINEPDLILLADKYGGFHAGERHRAQREVDLLRARADRITKTEARDV